MSTNPSPRGSCALVRSGCQSDLDRYGFRDNLGVLSSRRVPASTLVAVVLTVAVSLLGVRLFLRGSVPSCAEAGAACCCSAGSPDAPEGSRSGGCGCSVSPATPIPVAVLASVDGVPSPVLLAGGAGVGPGTARVAVAAEAQAVPRARSAPTQALLETFRN